MLDENKTIDRRTVVKGAAWSLPVIAVAAATPLASASHGGAHLSISADCLLQVAGVSAAGGFIVTNGGDATYTDAVTITERFHLNGILRTPLLADIIVGVFRAGTVIDYKAPGVTISSWSASDYLIPSTPFTPALSPATITRTVTITGGIAVGATPYWGRLLSVLKALSLPGIVGLDWLASVEHTATITTPTGEVVTKASDQMNYHLLDGSC